MKRYLILILLMTSFGIVLRSRHSIAQSGDEFIRFISWSPSGNNIAALTKIGDVFGDNDIVGIYDSETMQLIATIPNPQDTQPFHYEGISWNSDGTKVAVARQVSDHTAIQVWDVSSTPSQIVLDYHDQTTASGFGTALAWRPGFNQLAYSDNYKVNLLDVATGTVIQTYEGNHVYSSDEIAWSPDGVYLLASSLPGLLFNGATGSLINSLQEDQHFGRIAWSPDGTQFVAQYGDFFRIWNINPLQPVIQLPGDIGFSSAIDWRGNTIAASKDESDGVEIVFWDSQTYEMITTLAVNGSIFDLSLSPDGSQIVYGEDANIGKKSFPTANPGPNQTLTDTDNDGSELVTLDATASSDRDGTIETYEWLENDIVIAEGINAQVELELGEHTITLKVTDDDGLVDMAEVVIVVTD